MLKAFGAEVIVTPRQTFPTTHRRVTSRSQNGSPERPHGRFIQTVYNLDNPEIHYLTTGPRNLGRHRRSGRLLCCRDGNRWNGLWCCKIPEGTGAKSWKKGPCLLPKMQEGSIYQDSFYKRELREAKAYKVEGIGHDWLVGNVRFFSRR